MLLPTFPLARLGAFRNELHACFPRHAALWAAELAPSYAPELQVGGAAGLAPAPTWPPCSGWPGTGRPP